MHLGAKPLIRTWYCATAPVRASLHIDAFVQELTRELEAPTRRDWQAVGRLQRIERAATR